MEYGENEFTTDGMYEIGEQMDKRKNVTRRKQNATRTRMTFVTFSHKDRFDFMNLKLFFFFCFLLK